MPEGIYLNICTEVPDKYVERVVNIKFSEELSKKSVKIFEEKKCKKISERIAKAVSKLMLDFFQ